MIVAYTVKELAELSGVSTRTLRFYDEIQLLKPAYYGANGYRYYEEDQLLMLQQILFLRELEFPLEQIQGILQREDFNKIQALQSHKRLLEKKMDQTSILIQTITKTLAHLEGQTTIAVQDLYCGFAKEMTRNSYDTTAQEFSEKVAHLAPLESIQNFISLLPAHPKIIDIGCGSGRDAGLFSEHGATVVGIDFSSNLIELAKVQAPLAHFQVMDIEDLEFPPASFDGAWAACSLGHIAKREIPEVIKKINTLLKPGGYFQLALKKGVGESLMQDLRYEGNIKKFWSFFEEDEICNILEAAHFKILHRESIVKNDAYQTHDALKIICQKI